MGEFDTKRLECGCEYYLYSDTGAMKQRCKEYNRLADILCDAVEEWIPTGKAEVPSRLPAAKTADRAISAHLKGDSDAR